MVGGNQCVSMIEWAFEHPNRNIWCRLWRSVLSIKGAGISSFDT